MTQKPFSEVAKNLQMSTPAQVEYELKTAFKLGMDEGLKIGRGTKAKHKHAEGIADLHTLCMMAAMIYAQRTLDTEVCSADAAFRLASRVQNRLDVAGRQESRHDLTCDFRVDKSEACNCRFFDNG